MQVRIVMLRRAQILRGSWVTQAISTTWVCFTIIKIFAYQSPIQNICFASCYYWYYILENPWHDSSLLFPWRCSFLVRFTFVYDFRSTDGATTQFGLHPSPVQHVRNSSSVRSEANCDPAPKGCHVPSHGRGSGHDPGRYTDHSGDHDSLQRHIIFCRPASTDCRTILVRVVILLSYGRWI